MTASSPVERFDVGPRMSEMAVHNGVAYLAGQVPEDTTADIVGQTAQVLAAIDKLLERAGTDKTRILRAEIFLADRADFAGMNTAWEAWVAAGHTPPRATVIAGLARPEWKVEILITAAV
ncbi:MAG: RidA family protein [Pelomonas sp.]|nr:RidA family protein [Roseateles sp.]